MSQIDYNQLDGSPTVARRGAGAGTRIAMAALGLVLVGALVWLNWPRDPVPSDSNNEGQETFNPPEFRPPALSEQPQAADSTIDQIVVPPPADDKSKAQQADNVDQTVQEGADLDAQRRALEAQMAAEEARRKAAEEEARRKAAAEEQARSKAEAAEREKAVWERLRSNQMVTNDETSSTANGSEAGQAQIAPDGQIVPVPGADSDPNKAFLAQSEASSTGIAKARIFRRTDALIPEGTVIRGYLETAINTDLPGAVRAVVREDVFSLDGRRVLIPKGSRLTGEYRSGLARGQKRVFIVWNRVIRSDGISVDIKSPGADALGRGGMAGRVDTHWLERYGNAIMLSVVGGVSEYLSSLADSGQGAQQRQVTTIDPVTGETTTVTYGGNGSQRDARSIAFDKSSTALQQLAQEAFRDTQNIAPTVYVDQGTSVVVLVRRDLDFSDLYADPVQQELARLRAGGRPKQAIDPTPLFSTPKDHYYPGYGNPVK
ncbi:MAG: TrbI/VirB10 family protein [Mesorhizobium sp.]|uniref:type IV secretion system protein VirB10 n=1 Tax=Mesorhizobium sp. TaxID=1871066 RepID=UPI000FE839F6|nr:type IV secretion system protein VirB10 [Mesorhizobium sp.]RWI37020.1 MAG: TrbI/VirB10 family protein [Mesorhizobium sp.]RWI63266.1 MAG: TrbI/VirB10 family protein [Mesorhizobium sp.]RWI82540.1 MAG: TrbI/VirB10 family protein [Mesorhizobium sp.]RWJ46717.1 MAG: TrbI/VirB10 family protein [Mesorhizobium sp.]RWJ57512.1 MAG: TrbI/VirB10 family protein [Mesorhizobium sp.]